MDEPHALTHPRTPANPHGAPRDSHFAGEVGEAPARTSRRRRLVGLFLILVLAAAIVAALLRPGSHRASRNNAPAVQPVGASLSRLGDMPVTLTELGTVTSLATVTVQSQISGYLLEVNFLEGQEVKRGDQLALIDPRPYQATLDQYEGQLLRDSSALDLARIDLKRYQGLLAQHSIARQQVDDQAAIVGQDEGAVRSDQAQIESAKLNIAYCHITAPVDGRVGLRQVDAGNYVTPGLANGLVVLSMLHPISVIFSVPEDNLAAINARLRAHAVLPVEAYDRTNTKHLASGHVAVLDNQIDTTTGTVKLRAVFDNSDETLFPNEFVNAHLLVDTLRQAVLVPTAAVQTGPQGQFVYVIKPDSTVQVRPVTVGVTSSADSVITAGLKSGEQVVTDGTEHLAEGSKVMIPSADAPSAAAGKTDPQPRPRRPAGG